MSHVDEGALHAYLDGALDEFPAAEARYVREHLDSCAECRDRLEVERAIRDQAVSILGLAVPEVTVPSFEELRAYVRANAPRRSPVSVRIYRLGWAASVVLALGTGYLLRGEGGAQLEQLRTQEAPAFSPSAERDVAELERANEEAPAASNQATQGARPVPARQEVARGTAVAESQGRAAEAPQESTVATGAALLRAAVLTDDLAASADLVADLDGVAEPNAALRLDEAVLSRTDRQRLELPTAEVASIPAAPAPAAAREPSVEREKVVAADAADAVEPERRSAQADVVTSANAAASAAGITTLGRRVEFGDTRDERAQDEDSYSLVVPGLEVLDVLNRGAGVRPEGQVVLQRLPSGDTLRVVHLPLEIDPAELEDRAVGDTQLLVQRAAGWIVLRAPVSEEALLELLERLLSDPEVRD